MARAARDALLDRFLEMLMAERNAAPNTREAYERDLNDLAGFLAKRGVRPGEAGTRLLRDYLAALAGAGMAPWPPSRRAYAGLHGLTLASRASFMPWLFQERSKTLWLKLRRPLSWCD